MRLRKINPARHSQRDTPASPKTNRDRRRASDCLLVEALQAGGEPEESERQVEVEVVERGNPHLVAVRFDELDVSGDAEVVDVDAFQA